MLPELLVQTSGTQAQTGKDYNLIQCRGRGILRKHKTPPLVGDYVIYELTENGEGMVDEIMPRASEMIRAIANVKLAVLMFSLN